MKIYKLRTNHIEKPMGFNLDNFCLSWIVEDEESDFVEKSKVEISIDKCFKDIVFNSGIQKDIDSLCYKPNLKLQKRKRYYWRVTVWGDKENYSTSEISWFETGKMDEKWSANWITPNMDSEVHPLMRKCFDLKDEFVSARMYISGLGFYDFEINGERIGDEYLTPGINAYDYWIQYQTYDVTKNLLKGENCIGIHLGNGMYKGRFGFDGGYTNLYGDRFALICELIITLKDGSIYTIKSDESFKCTESPIEFSGIYDGEIYDANKEVKGWSEPKIDDSNWKNVNIIDLDKNKLKDRLSLPVKIKEIIKPLELIETSRGEKVLDMGQNMSGWVRFKCRAKKGQTLKLQFGEILQEGCFYRENLRTAKAEYVYISNGEEAIVQPHFTYYGFRYVNLIGFENIELDDFEGCVLYSDIEDTGKVETSNKFVNRLFENAKWGQKGNFIDVPTDCPQRDERMGWTGDAEIFVSTACYNMYSPAFYKKYMFDLHEEQKRRGGSVPFVVPSIKPKKGSGLVNRDGAAVWGDAATIIPWTLYMQYGDYSLLEGQLNTMKEWVDYIKEIDDNTGSTRLWTVGFQFGDWLALDAKEGDLIGATDPYYVSSAYYYYSANLVSKAAKVLGKDDLYKKYYKLSEEIKDAIQKEYFSPNGRSTIDTQTAMVIAIYMDLVPESHKRRLIKDLKNKLKDNNMHLNTGFVGTAHLTKVLSENGANKEAYKLLLNEDYPSWLYAVKLGATTIWERWNSVLEDGSISGTDMNSLNHYAYGSIAEWMYKDMCGIKPVEDSPGFRKIKFEPRPYGRLRYAVAKFNSPCGYIESGWKINDNGTLEFNFNIPFNTKGEVILPDAKGKEIYINGVKLTDTDIRVMEKDNNIICFLKRGKYLISYMPNIDYILKYGTYNNFNELLANDDIKEILEEIIPEIVKSPIMNFINKNDSLREFNPVMFALDGNWDNKLTELDKRLNKILVKL